MKRALISFGILAGVFLAGYVPMYMKNRSLVASCQEARTAQTEQIAKLEGQLRFSQLAGQAGRILIEVEEGNFGNARSLSTKLFDGLRMEAGAVPLESDRERLRGLLGRRDEITADLTALNPGVATKLRQLFVELQK